ncbi:MAG TPA: flagellar hook-length control protein FliK [Gammaproteobacteria bacterium]|nr:flagellar hook-length control protein FliK [Gammaproteobacteria bacterium]
MTSPVPLLPGKNGTWASAAPERSSLGPAESGQGAGRPFSSVLHSQPAARSAQRDKPETGAPERSGQADSSAGGGKALPSPASRDSAGHGQVGQPSGAAPPKTEPDKAQTSGKPQVGDAPAKDTAQGTPLPPELADMLKALLAGGPQDNAPRPGGGQAQSPGHKPDGGDFLSRLLARIEAQTGAGQQHHVAPAGGLSMGQLLKDMASGGPAADHTAQQVLAMLEGKGGQGGAQPDPLAAALQPPQGGPDAGASLNFLQQPLLFQQQANGGQPGPQQALLAMLQGGGPSPQASTDAGALMQQILSQPVTPQALNSLAQGLAAGDHKGVKGPAGASTSASSTPSFTTVYTNPMTPGQPSAAAAQMTPMPQPFNQQAWDDALSHNVMWMAKNNMQTASLQLNPPHLGPLELKVSLNQDQANVSFVVHHAAVRDAIEGALPKLRELFGDGGVNLANVDVSDHSGSGQHTAGSDQGTGDGRGQAPAGQDIATGLGAEHAGAVARVPLGLVDYFA